MICPYSSHFQDVALGSNQDSHLHSYSEVHRWSTVALESYFRLKLSNYNCLLHPPGNGNLASEFMNGIRKDLRKDIGIISKGQGPEGTLLVLFDRGLRLEREVHILPDLNMLTVNKTADIREYRQTSPVPLEITAL